MKSRQITPLKLFLRAEQLLSQLPHARKGALKADGSCVSPVMRASSGES